MELLLIEKGVGGNSEKGQKHIMLQAQRGKEKGEVKKTEDVKVTWGWETRCL